MSTKMNFGPEWMRSTPAQAKATANGSAGGAAANAVADAAANGYASVNPPDRAADSAAPPEPRRYTQEMMLQLFKPQDLTHDFVASEHVFSGPSLAPVSLTALSAKEQELLAGSINSGASKRYNSNNQQHQHQHQHQQHYARSNAASLQRSGSYGPMSAVARAKHKDTYPGTAAERSDYAFNIDSAVAGLENDSAVDAEESLWAHQSLARESVGSFGADGVFRMGSANDDDALEGPASRNSTRGDALRDPDDFTSRSGSPAVASSRIGTAAGLLSRTHSHSRAHPRLSDTRSAHASSALDVGTSSASWNDLAARPPGYLQQQQQQTQSRLVERAELVKWWYRDPQGNIQGPFSVANMQDWYSGDYFPADLHVCHEGGPGFEPLGALIARIGDDQNVFLYASLASIAQSLQQRGSGISTPATPGTISRAASAVQLATLSSDVSSAALSANAPAVSNIGIGALAGGSQGSPVAAINGAAASLASSTSADVQPGTAGSTAASPSASGPPSQAAQLSILLNEQLLLVSAISDRQRNILGLQEQLQQSQNKLMQELSHETNAIHYRAQLENLPIQHELLYALQQRAQVAEERLRIEFTQLIQVQAAQISQLEASIDPVIKDIVLRNGTSFALNFIGQQLQDLSNQAASDSNTQVADTTQSTGVAENTVKEPQAYTEVGAAEAAKSPTKDRVETSADSIITEDVAETAKQTAQKSDTASFSDIQTKLASIDISSEAAPPTLPKSNSADKTAAPSKASAGASSKPQATTPVSASAKTASTKTKPAGQTAAPVSEKSAAASAGKASPAAVSPKIVSVSAASPAPWSTSAKPKQPKKSLLQIQQEEEEAMKKRQQAEEQLRAQNPMTRSFTGSYADRLGGASSNSTAPRSLASIMEEQSKENVKSAGVASPLTAGAVASSRPDGPRTLTLAEAAAPAPPALASQSSSRTGTATATSPSTPTPTSAWGSVSSPAVSFAISAAATAATAAAAGASGSASSASASGPASGSAASSNAASKSHGVKKPSSVPSSVTNASSSVPSKSVSAASIVSTTTISAMPSMKFLEWCYSRLGSLRGIDITKFIEVLLTFPMQQSESTLEIIAEQIYAYSPTLNGRAFAEDFMTRRRKDFGSVRGGSLKSAPPNWMQILNSSAGGKPSSQGMSLGGSDFVRVTNAGASRGTSAESSFQVVGSKKGRR